MDGQTMNYEQRHTCNCALSWLKAEGVTIDAFVAYAKSATQPLSTSDQIVNNCANVRQPIEGESA
jgi:hypothetical protein